MQIVFVGIGPDGERVMDFTLNHYKLPPEHLVELAGLCKSYAAMINNRQGAAAGNDETKMSVEFTYDAKQTFTLPTELKPTFKNSGKQDELTVKQYNRTVEAGLKLLMTAQEAARREEVSGEDV